MYNGFPNSKEAKQLRKKCSMVAISCIERDEQRKQAAERNKRIRSFEAKCLKCLIERFKSDFGNDKELLEATKECVSGWIENGYKQNYVGALVQLQVIVEKELPDRKDVFVEWVDKQTRKYRFLVEMASSNDYMSEKTQPK